MSLTMKLYKILLVLILAWAIISTIIAANYYSMYVKSQKTIEGLKSTLGEIEAKVSDLAKKYIELRKMLLNVSLAIDYGNGTIIWYNGTMIPNGSTLLSLTVFLAKVEYKLYPIGAYVTSINGVKERILTPGKEGYSWLWYFYDKEKGSWILGKTSADNYLLHDGDVVKWVYTHWKF